MYLKSLLNRQDSKGARKNQGEPPGAKNAKNAKNDQMKNQKRFFNNFSWRSWRLGGSKILASLASLALGGSNQKITQTHAAHADANPSSAEILMRDVEQTRFIEVIADQLQTHRQVVRETRPE